jgi:hypothetical protein
MKQFVLLIGLYSGTFLVPLYSLDRISLEDGRSIMGTIIRQDNFSMDLVVAVSSKTSVTNTFFIYEVRRIELSVDFDKYFEMAKDLTDAGTRVRLLKRSVEAFPNSPEKRRFLIAALVKLGDEASFHTYRDNVQEPIFQAYDTIFKIKKRGAYDCGKDIADALVLNQDDIVRGPLLVCLSFYYAEHGQMQKALDVVESINESTIEKGFQEIFPGTFSQWVKVLRSLNVKTGRYTEPRDYLAKIRDFYQSTKMFGFMDQVDSSKSEELGKKEMTTPYSISLKRERRMDEEIP